MLMQLDLRSVVSGMFINALRLGDRGGQIPIPRIGLVLPVMFVMGGAVALFVLLTLQHQHGLRPYPKTLDSADRGHGNSACAGRHHGQVAFYRFR
ncbi:MAG: hypothetical protein HC898_13050 [Phycisphaerales bacterium]|nr:hypothetical protein [Phycisphaerales bacterium]